MNFLNCDVLIIMKNSTARKVISIVANVDT